jgi:hypothetical protein
LRKTVETVEAVEAVMYINVKAFIASTAFKAL